MGEYFSTLIITVFISGVFFGGTLGLVLGALAEDVFNIVNGRNKGTNKEEE
jgi:hypothetical protein